MKWTTKDGKELDVREMETNHIENCIKYCKRKNGEEYGFGDLEDGCYFTDIIDYDDEIRVFENELRLRKIEENL